MLNERHGSIYYLPSPVIKVNIRSVISAVHYIVLIKLILHALEKLQSFL